MMRKPLGALLVFVLSAPAAHAQDFRGLHWGVPIESIGELQGRDVTERDHPVFGRFVSYGGQAEGADATLFFGTDDGGGLVHGIVLLDADYEDRNLYVDRYEEIRRILTERHGAPIEDEASWTDDTLRDRREQRGDALFQGHVRYRSAWRTPQSLIIAFLGFEEGFPLLGINYTSASWAEARRGELAGAQAERIVSPSPAPQSAPAPAAPGGSSTGTTASAKIFLFRPRKMVAAAAKPLVSVRGPGVHCEGLLKNGTYFEVTVPPGTSGTFEVQFHQSAMWLFPGSTYTTARLVPGGEYFGQLHVSMAEYFLAEVSTQEARKFQRKLKPVELRCY